jgi:hypothetical protein
MMGRSYLPNDTIGWLVYAIVLLVILSRIVHHERRRRQVDREYQARRQAPQTVTPVRPLHARKVAS